MSRNEGTRATVRDNRDEMNGDSNRDQSGNRSQERESLAGTRPTDQPQLFVERETRSRITAVSGCLTKRGRER